MARGVTLGQMVADLRAEVGHSADAALGKNKLTQLKRILQRTQAWLYEDYDWPFLSIQETVSLRAGQRFYDFPATITVEDVKRYTVKWGLNYLPIESGIGPSQYSFMESEQTGAAGTFTVTAGAAAAAHGGFTINAGTLGSGHQITQITVNGVSLLTAAIAWGTSHTATAAAVVSAINNTTTVPNYTASNVGAAVTITADPDLGSSANGWVVSVTVGGDVTVTSTSNMASGADNFVSAITADGLDLLDGAVVGWRTSNTATAAAIAAKINATITVPSYSATSAANQVTITADPESEDAGNARVLLATGSGAVTLGTPVDFTGGVLSVRADPAQNVALRNNDDVVQMEVWPVPASSDQVMHLFAKKPLLPLVANADVSTLDANLIVLMAAAEILEGQKDKRSTTVSRVAINLYNRLRGRATGAHRRISFASDGASSYGGRPAPGPIRVAYAR